MWLLAKAKNIIWIPKSKNVEWSRYICCYSYMLHVTWWILKRSCLVCWCDLPSSLCVPSMLSGQVLETPLMDGSRRQGRPSSPTACYCPRHCSERRADPTVSFSYWGISFLASHSQRTGNSSRVSPKTSKFFFYLPPKWFHSCGCREGVQRVPVLVSVPSHFQEVSVGDSYNGYDYSAFKS